MEWGVFPFPLIAPKSGPKSLRVTAVGLVLFALTKRRERCYLEVAAPSWQAEPRSGADSPFPTFTLRSRFVLGTKFAQVLGGSGTSKKFKNLC
ncbi:hypothetical protein C8J27_106222 [Rhodobacter aestuarii]|uniref:Uncharacterized protein n=1 Tax=Rhodobacter aestuarii TaxID=453582 RepID=A0A1N7MAN9_9RHOB|nr:hypothetical protein C8J27_106222 [Rhodobacter aestuarii]SIS83041.1 hypothetical protein SAMN05421580_105222 [Rhodobacter aestuarii]